MNTVPLIVHWWVVFTILLISVGNTAELIGSLSSGAYFQEDKLDTTSKRTTVYEGVNLQARNLGSSGVSLYSGIYATNGFTTTIQNPVELSHLYLDWRGLDGALALKLGRHYQYQAIDPMYIDGLSMVITPYKRLNILLAGGISTPSREAGKLMALGYNRDPIEGMLRINYSFSNQFMLGTGYQQGLPVDKSRNQTVEVLTRYTSRYLSLYGNADYNFLTEQLQEGQVVFHLFPSEVLSVSLLGAVYDREIDSSSHIEQLFLQRRSEGGVEYTIGRASGFQTRGSYTIRLIESASTTHSYSLSVYTRRFSYSFTHDISSNGWAIRTGPSVKITPWLATDLWVRAMRYTAAPFMNYSTSNSEIAVVSLRITPIPAFRARVDFEGLANRYYTSDFRVAVKTDILLSTFSAEKR